MIKSVTTIRSILEMTARKRRLCISILTDDNECNADLHFLKKKKKTDFDALSSKQSITSRSAMCSKNAHEALWADWRHANLGNPGLKQQTYTMP